MLQNREYLRPRLPLGNNSKRLGMFGIVFIILFAAAPWITFSVGQGQITAIDPNSRVQTITASVDGFIGEWFVSEGQFVKAGDPIVNLVDNDPLKLDRLQTQKTAAEEALASAELMLETARINFNRQDKLFREGLSSRKDYELAKIKVEKLNLDMNKSLSDLKKMETEVSRQSSQAIKAPRNGTVTRILPGEKGQLIKSGSPIVIFTPEITSPAVEVWIDGNDVAYLQAGMPAQIQFEGWPTLQVPGWPAIAINTFHGKVYLVDQASSKDGKFRVLIRPDAKWPSENLLRLGMKAKSYIKIRDSFVLREIWRIMNGLPALNAPIDDELKEILSPASVYDKTTTKGRL